MRNKRRKVKPRELKKASRSRQQYSQGIEVAGKRDATTTGYRIPGTMCSDYETFFEHLAEGQRTDTMLHETKTRTYRVLSGRGYALLAKGEQQKSVVLMPGTELTVEAGIRYSLATTSRHNVEFFVSQSAKYEEALIVIEKTSTSALMDPEELQSVSQVEAITKQLNPPRRRRGRSKAAQQQLKMRRERGQVVSEGPTPAVVDSNDSAFSTNLKPTFGSDLRGAPG